MAEQAGALAFPISVERTCSAHETVLLLSRATEWRTGHAVAADAHTCTKNATSPAPFVRHHFQRLVSLTELTVLSSSVDRGGRSAPGVLASAHSLLSLRRLVEVRQGSSIGD